MVDMYKSKINDEIITVTFVLLTLIYVTCNKYKQHCYQLLKMANEIEETIKRLHSHEGVEGIIVINSEGIAIKSTMENAITVQYAGLISSLAEKSRSVVRDLDPSNDLIFIRVRSRKHEIMVAPDREYILMVIQTPVN